MFARPIVNPSSDLRSALGRAGVRARDARPEHLERLRALDVRPHILNEMRSLIEANGWVARRPEHLRQSVRLLVELQRLAALQAPERRSGCALPRFWSLKRERAAFSYSTSLSAEQSARAVLVARVRQFLEIGADVGDLPAEIGARVEAVALVRVDGRALIEAITWDGVALGVVFDSEVLVEVISIINAQSKKDAGRVTFA